ncbi:hypothetical protein CAP35_13315 [Chitinophagaceae bacterium IBVUCB1]|nr:hypothetical protein CAP35_13315 [Chitinophagaceae bacterium IBVUCB1]
MRKNLLLILAMLCTIVANAQFTFSGTVLTTTGAPVVGQTVWVMSDSSRGWSGTTHGAFFSTSAVTNSTGAYTVTMPSTTLSGHPIWASTVNCTGGSPATLSNLHTYAGVNITSNFTKCVPPPPATISGQITHNSTGAANAKVYLIAKSPDSIWVGTTVVFTWKLTALDSALTNSSGNYSMTYPTSRPDSLLVKAALLPASSNYSSYLPTYHTSSLIWSGATTIAPGGTGSITRNIALIGGTNPGGPGFIGGSVVLGANKSTAAGDPLPGRLIILTNASNQAVAYTYSNASGQFSFNVPYGSYKIFGDVMGKTSAPLSFTLSTAMPSASAIKFEEKALTFDAKMTTGIAGVATQTAGIFPNPAKNNISITGLTGNATVTVYDVMGKVVATHAVSASNNEVNIANLPTGNYVLKLATASDVTTVKLVKE